MIEKLVEWDRQVSVAINAWHSDWADAVMIFLSNRNVWIPLYLFLVGYIIYIYKKKAVWILLGVALLIAVADWTSVHWFKNVVQRLRPCHEPLLDGLLNLPRGRNGGLYGFVSSHAVNHFALAAFLTPWFKKDRYFYGALYVWAVAIGYSRIYLAAHYLGDVICGGLWGALLGLLFYYGLRWGGVKPTDRLVR